MGAIYFLRTPLISYAGIVLFGISIILAGTISAQLKDSWRVGVHEDQKTTLMKDGVYAYARNPYFISYYIMYFSLFLIRPSIILMVLVLATVALFHRMVLNPDCAVDIYCGLKILVATLVSLRFSAPRYGAYCTIWVKRRNPFIFYAWERIRKI